MSKPTLAHIIKDCRAEVDDDGPDPLCPDSSWIRFADEAQNEAFRRARLAVDSTTQELCRINLRVGVPSYPLDPRVLFIRRAKLTGFSGLLARKQHWEMDERFAGWESEEGEVRAYVTGLDDGAFRPYRIPTETGVVTLTVVRLPLCALTKKEQEPELRAHLIPGMRRYMKHLYYSIKDSEVKDPKAAAEELGLFELEFGKKSSGLDESWLAREADHTEAEGNY